MWSIVFHMLKLMVKVSDFVMDLMVGKETSVSYLCWIEVS